MKLLQPSTIAAATLLPTLLIWSGLAQVNTLNRLAICYTPTD